MMFVVTIEVLYSIACQCSLHNFAFMDQYQHRSMHTSTTPTHNHNHDRDHEPTNTFAFLTTRWQNALALSFVYSNFHSSKWLDFAPAHTSPRPTQVLEKDATVSFSTFHAARTTSSHNNARPAFSRTEY